MAEQPNSGLPESDRAKRLGADLAAIARGRKNGPEPVVQPLGSEPVANEPGSEPTVPPLAAELAEEPAPDSPPPSTR